MDHAHRRSKVLQTTENVLNLPEGALEPAWQPLAMVGDLASAPVMLVLEEFMGRRRPEPGSFSVLAAMGPGFCSELLLLQW